MSAKILDFPTTEPPEPFRPASAVREYLATEGCNAVVSSRIPWDLKRYLLHEAFVSDARFSEHVARILASHREMQRLHRRLRQAA